MVRSAGEAHLSPKRVRDRRLGCQGEHGMKTLTAKLGMACLAAASALLCTGCDSEGVTDIVFGALRMAFGIVNVSTGG